MESRNASKTDPKSGPKPVQSDPVEPPDLFALDLSSELPNADSAASAPELLPLEDDPFAGEYQLADLSVGSDDPFAVLPAVVSEPVVAKVIGSEKDAALSGKLATEGLINAAVVTTDPKTPVGKAPAGKEPAAPLVIEATEEAAAAQADLVRRRFYLTALPSWAISLGVHVAVLFLLAALSMDPIREAIGVALDAGGGNEGETLDDTELPVPQSRLNRNRLLKRSPPLLLSSAKW